MAKRVPSPSSPSLPTVPFLTSKNLSAHLALVVTAVIFGSLVRVWNIPTAFLFGDELHSLRLLGAGFQKVISTYDTWGTGLALPAMQLALTKLLGFNHWSIRLPALLGGLAALGSLYIVAKPIIGRMGAALAVCFLAVNPIHIFYSGFGRSYALMCFLSLLLLGCLHRMTERQGVRKLHYVTLALLCGLLPYLHLVSLGLVLPVVGATGLVLGLTPPIRARLGWFVASVVAGGALSVLLYLPAWESTLHFIRTKTSTEYYGQFGVVDVVTLLAGTHAGAYILLLTAPVLAALFLKKHGRSGVPIVVGFVGPPLLLVLAKPAGDAYAYARYLMSTIPALTLLTAWGVVACVDRCVDSKSVRRVTSLTLGVALSSLMFLAGGYGLRHTPDGPYVNTYISMYPLPAFDVAYVDQPAFYQTLQNGNESVKIIETPALGNRSRHLYRAYYLQHRRETYLAFYPMELSPVPAGPYVWLGAPDWHLRTDADYLIVHLDVLEEVHRYWKFVYEQYGELIDNGPSKAYMTRHLRYYRNRGLPKPSPAFLQHLTTKLGVPFHADADMLVWKLRSKERRP